MGKRWQIQKGWGNYLNLRNSGKWEGTGNRNSNIWAWCRKGSAQVRGIGGVLGGKSRLHVTDRHERRYLNVYQGKNRSK